MITFKSTSQIKEDNPITLAIYAKDNNILEVDQWKSLKKYVRCKKKLHQLIKQAKH